MDEMDDFLKEPEEVEEPIIEEVKEPEPEEPKGEEAAPPAAEEEERAPEEMIPRAALMDERRKRQELEQQIQQFQQWQQAQQKQPDPEEINSKWWDNPAEQIQSIEQRFNQQLEQRLTVERMNLSEAMVRQAHPDYEEKLETFKEIAQHNPALFDQVQKSANPAKTAYDIASNALKLKQLSDPSFQQQKEAELRKQLEAEYQKKMEEELARRLPGSLTESRAAGTNANPGWSGPSSLDEILS